MSRRSIKGADRLLSYALRHEPAALNVKLDVKGYADVEEILQGLAARGLALSRKDLESVVANNDKKRFAFSADGTRLRASQGHSILVALDYDAVPPPAILYHGTASRFLPSIEKLGIMRRERLHVHLSASEETALKVGKRHGEPVVLEVDSARMQSDGHAFYVSDNGVWLVEHVPVTYVTVRAGHTSGRP